MQAAVSVSEGSLGAVLEKLQLLAAECSRIKGVRSQVGFLRSELASMHALLRKVADMEDPDIQVKAWAREVREMAYDIEDCVDAFTRRLGGDEPHGQGQGGIKEFFGKCARFLLTLRSWHRFADQIDELKSRVVEVAERRERYRLDDLACGNSSSGVVDPRLSALFADEDHLAGIDGPRNNLAQWLVVGRIQCRGSEGPGRHSICRNPDFVLDPPLLVEGESGLAKHRKVLSIVGFGGLGKTTLANAVYRKIGGKFQCKAFVSVSQKPDTKKIRKAFLLQLADHEPKFIKGIDAWDEKKIITKMREFLRDKRYLIVIDDVWSTSAWDAIKCAFPENTCSSRIITTTRIIDVAGSCCSCTDGWVYQMEPLNYHYSKRLFLKRIFGSEECDNQLQEVSDEILKKCGGLPLAIISISGLLANKPAVKEEWEKVRDSVGSALEKHKTLEGMKDILTLSYNDLPCHLKTCLLYLSIFPEDCTINKDRLVNRWIAEGFIPQERGQSLQDVSNSYFYELINKSMVQPVGIGYDGKACACRIHDIMLELIISKATEENFITVIGSQAAIAYPQCNIRRLCIQHADQEVASVLVGKDVSHARSLTAFGLVKYLPCLVQFEVLRVLDLEGCMGLDKYDLNNIDKLTHLKYLSLRGTRISKVPPEIVKLHCLETLDLRETCIVELPSGIVHLTKLQHLLTANWDEGLTTVPDGIGNMRNLQVLSGFNISRSSASAVEELGRLTSLKELHAQLDGQGSDNNRHEEILLSSVCKLGSCKLQSLWICSDDSSPLEFLDSWSPLPSSLQTFQMTTNYFLPKIPKWITPALTSLAYLNINLSEVTEEDLRILGELSALLSLELWFKTNKKEGLTVRGRGFRCLKEFFIVRAGASGYLLFEEGAMPKVEKVRLPFFVSMAKAYGFNLGIKNLPCLKDAVVDLHDKSATSSESKAAAVAIRNEANEHPNRPRVTIFGLWRKEHSDTDEQESEEERGTDEEDSGTDEDENDTEDEVSKEADEN